MFYRGAGVRGGVGFTIGVFGGDLDTQLQHPVDVSGADV